MPQAPQPSELGARLEASQLEQFAAADQWFAGREPAALRHFLRSAYPDDPDVGSVSRLVNLALNGRVPAPELSEVGTLFTHAIENVRARWFGDPTTPTERLAGHRIAGLEFDFLGERRDVADWSIAQTLLYLLMRRIKPSRRAAVVGTMRDDGLYALEWVAHYQTLGFELLVIYSNDNLDGSEHLLRRLAEQGQIIFVESRTAGMVRPEVKAFDHALQFVPEMREHEWGLFVDSDELLILAPRFQNRIGALLEEIDHQEVPPAAILYQWLWYNSGMRFDRRPGLLLDRFRYASDHWLAKPMVRLRDVLTMRLQHVPELFPGASMVDSGYFSVDVEEAWTPRAPNYTGGRLNHYWPKSFQEFSLKKARGDALPITDDEYRRSFELFFQWNAEETPETYHPPDETFLRAVGERVNALRALPGVRAAEAEVERRYSTLLNRYDAEGGLRRIYERLHETTESGLQAPP